jgi:type II secretory pathway component PulC
VKDIIESDNKSIPVKTQIIKEEHRIKFIVTGIVINGENKNIVLNDETNSNVVFLKEGESYQGLKIVRVSKHEVELLHISSGDKIISPLK